jgi:hypothetical protein
MDYFAAYCFGLSVIILILSSAFEFLVSFLEERSPYAITIKAWMAKGYLIKTSLYLFIMSLFSITFHVIVKCILDDMPLGTRIVLGIPCALCMVMSFLFLWTQLKLDLLDMKDHFRSLKKRE